MVTDEVIAVMDALHQDGGEARFVGGCVRDALVNRKNVDIDIATPLRPEEVIQRLEKAKIKYVPTGLKHGTVTALVDGTPFEITTLRVDVKPQGRHAEVAFTDDWEQDAARRDFTFNAMSATMEGDVFDPFGGIEDLRTGRVIFVGKAERRIKEDVLRILRYFRFFAHYGQGAPDPSALKACAALADHIPKLSAERIRDELLKLLSAERCALVWKLMLSEGIVTHFLPEATNTAALETLLRLEHDHHSAPFVLRRLAALLEVTKEALPRLSRGLRLSNEQAWQLMQLSFPPMKVATTMSSHDMRRLVHLTGNDMARSLLLLASAREGGTADISALYQVATAFRPPRFPLVGQDVMMLGIKPGPEIGRILGEMENWWIDRDFKPGRGEALEYLKTCYTPRAKGG
ncbi:MAG: CCA tRNA nucleotidyltransferase [Alphaproteobacteria bacterium]|nr:CCA tRNA nucleotidyltransferase [Alphaproteobacteria bacterium]